MKITNVVLVCCIVAAGCSTQPPAYDPERDLGLLWVKHSAEYRAITKQVYASATAALPGFIDDRSWSVVPGQIDAADLPVAVILDVDETSVSNVDFQLTFERPFANWKLEKWTSETAATPIAGAAEFVAAARAAGVTVYFITNRPCEPIDGVDESCPQKQSTINDLAEAGIVADADHVMLSEEQGWNREKSVRRNHIAQTHRVITRHAPRRRRPQTGRRWLRNMRTCGATAGTYCRIQCTVRGPRWCRIERVFCA
jgi:acid phosphatase